MASADQLQEHADWRARQKERERERRRMRDRQRRQSMSMEEREKHLARRRKNYQLRRQRAATATAQLGFGGQTNMSSSDLASWPNRGIELETLTSDNNLAIVCVSEVKHLQCDEAASVGMKHDKDDNDDDPIAGNTKFHSSYKYPRLPRLRQIRKLARGGLKAANEELSSEQAFLGNNIRLIHVKHLARALNSSVGKVCEKEFQGQENICSRMNDDSEGVYWSEAVH